MSQWFRSMVVLAVLSTMLSGCFMSRVTSRGTPGIHESETGFSLLWGITSTKTGATECEYGLQEVATYFPWYWWALYGITAGIVMPIVKDYTCNATPPGATAVQPGTFVAPPPPPM